VNEPKTLLQMSGDDHAPGRLSNSVLIVIDAQNEYVSGRLPLVGVDAALERIAELLAAARAARTPVMHIVQRGVSGGAFDPETDGFGIAPLAAPVGIETPVKKRLPNSFVDTSLRERLQMTGRKSLILTGFMTHMGVSSTARAAVDLGYRTTIVSDATATRDLPDPLGGPPISAEEVHRAALAALADRFAIVARTADIVGT
jgi:nicotinamidase-related amidase